MRINYYQFPEDIDPHTMWLNGAEGLGGTGTPGEPDAVCTEADPIINGISVREAKRLLKQFGGRAWTEHVDRSGGCFEVTEINLKGNNSRFKYNRHL